MFTFSFGSAFASLPWTGEATSKYLTEENDYTAIFDAAGTRKFDTSVLKKSL